MYVLLTGLHTPTKHGQGCILALWEFQKKKGIYEVSAELPTLKNVKAKKK